MNSPRIEEYRFRIREWTKAREVAGGELPEEGEVWWTEYVHEVWEEMTWEERDEVHDG